VLRNYESEEVRGFAEVDGMSARKRYFIRIPFAKLKSEVESYRYGSGSSTGRSGFYGWGNYDTKESFVIYEGRVDLRSYPYMGDPAPEPDSTSDWCTLVYRPPSGSIGFFEMLSRMF
jgi:hypothetical protein